MNTQNDDLMKDEDYEKAMWAELCYLDFFNYQEDDRVIEEQILKDKYSDEEEY